jgi:hypothetical protein
MFINWIDKLPFKPLLVVAVFFALAPYPFEPVPHLVDKVVLLSTGFLTKPIDIFDLFIHSAPLLLVVVKLVRLMRAR